MRKSVLFLSLVFTFNANAGCDEQGYFDCGTTGDVKWYVSNDKKTLTIKGSGNMEDYVNESNPNYDETNPKSAAARTTAPWGILSNEIESVVVEKGVTGLGQSCFQGLDHVTDIKLPDGLQTIGQQAFDRVKSLESLSVPDSVNQIGYAAFAWTTSLKTMDVGDGFETVSELSPLFGVGISDNPRGNESITTFYCQNGTTNQCAYLNVFNTNDTRVCTETCNFSDVVLYEKEGNRYLINAQRYKSINDFENNVPVKRIYTVEEAIKISKPTGNTFKIRYQ